MNTLIILICTLSILIINTTEIVFSLNNFILFSVNIGNKLSTCISEFSIWNFLILIIFLSIIGLWTYSVYLEFDSNYLVFSLKLISFLFTVWLVLNSTGNFLILFSWELVGLISFNLISTWISRTWTMSSSFSAIGFNRCGDVGLLIFIVSINININLFNNIVIYLFIILCFKSVSFNSYLWLPEAMEGPTPVSSLLHSCTLVMAGIFAMFNFGQFFSLTFLNISIFSLIIVSILARVEKDFKRVIAISTVIMVSLIWLLLFTSLNVSAIIICLIHASYKSAIFLSVGRLLSKLGIYHDGIGINSSIKSCFLFIIIFLFGIKSSNYSGHKHNIDIINTSFYIDFLIFLLISLSLIILWIFTLRFTNILKSQLAVNNNDFQIFLMSASLFLFQLWLFSSNSYTSNSIIFIIFYNIKFFVRIIFNIGSINYSLNLNSIISSRYKFIINFFINLTNITVHYNLIATGLFIVIMVLNNQ